MPNWAPSVVNVSEWGTFQLVVNGVDVTWFRDSPVQIKSWSDKEPFDDDVLEVAFPQISPFEALPTWLVDHASVALYLIRPNNTKLLLFEGQFSDEGDSVSPTEFGTTIQFMGALYQANYYRKPPELTRPRADTVDIAAIIQRELTPNNRPQLRLLPAIKPGNMGIIYTQKGGWDYLLDGYIQDMLAIATSSGLPAPGEGIVGITLKPNGLGYWLVGTKGSVLPFGDVDYRGSMLGLPLQEPASRIAVNSDGSGYWFTARDGGVFSFNVNFFGSLGQVANPNDIIAIEAHPDNQGYWLADVIGGVFAFGSAQYYGGLPDAGAPDLVSGDKVIDLGRTPSGLGYFLATEKGYVYAFGDAVYNGGQQATGKTFVAMSVRATGSYWLLASDGTVYSHGGAPLFTPNPLTGTTLPVADITGTPSGNGYLIVAQDGGVFAFGDAVFYGSVPGGGGFDSQWTLMLDKTIAARQPIIRVKDTKVVRWTIACGAPGIGHELNRDLSTAPNVFFGEGIDLEGCHWRNTRYPNLRPGSAPIFNGTELKIGSTHADVRIWETEMNARWSSAIAIDGKFSPSDSNQCRRFQKQAGLSETGTINAQTWAATFQVGSNGADLNGAFYWPLAADARTERHLYNPMGNVIGANSSFDPQLVRIETHDHFGARVTKEEGIISAATRLRREKVPAYTGTLTLLTDPIEGCRFEIRAGQNIKFKHHRGSGDAGRIFHISEAEKDWTNLQVTLQVDEKARDWQTLAAIRQRYREGTDPSGRSRRTYRNSSQVEDRRAIWDCEAGGGTIPKHAIGASLWNVLRIPVGEAGQIVRAEFSTDSTAARLSVGVFDRPTTAAYLVSKSSLGPLELTNNGDEYWDQFEPDTGLIIAWGTEGQAGGYYPGLESEGDATTGKLVDDASWYYETPNPPWVWVAMWSTVATNIQGKLFPGVE